MKIAEEGATPVWGTREKTRKREENRRVTSS
jgi:hypothetical protein